MNSEMAKNTISYFKECGVTPVTRSHTICFIIKEIYEWGSCDCFDLARSLYDKYMEGLPTFLTAIKECEAAGLISSVDKNIYLEEKGEQFVEKLQLSEFSKSESTTLGDLRKLAYAAGLKPIPDETLEQLQKRFQERVEYLQEFATDWFRLRERCYAAEKENEKLQEIISKAQLCLYIDNRKNNG